MNHSCDSGNGFVHQDDFNLYEEIEKNDYQVFKYFVLF